ncbi:MAG: signal peptide peptidase SppA [Deltaproteobacteria bacterium]|nr:signal peptide peptidase SppA [Deltaproteobacteria bacterium]
MRRSRLLILVLVLFLFLVLVGSVLGIVAMLDTDGGGRVADNSVLLLDISGPLPQQPLPDQPISGLGPDVLSIFDIDQALRRAAVDDRIARVLVRPKALQAGFARVHELRDILTQFSIDSGKPITCFMETAGNKEYLLATACDAIYMPPEGFLLVNGLHMGVTFYKGTLDKIGVEAEFTRAGKYKSAVEPLTSTEMSPAFREMLESMADSLYDDFVTTIAAARKLSEDQVRQLIDDPPITPSAAMRSGLIDGLYYRDQLIGHLGGYDVASVEVAEGGLELPGWSDVSEIDATGLRESSTESTPPPMDNIYGLAIEAPEAVEPAANGSAEPTAPTDEATEEPAAAEAGAEPKQSEESPPWFDAEEDLEWVRIKNYRKGQGGSTGTRRSRIALIFCEGQIMSGRSDSGGYSGIGGTMGSDTIAAAIRKAREDARVEAIILRVDSPGGSGLASDIIWREVELARKRNNKPVVVSMGDYAASGGYYIAMGADAIVAQPTTITGSIGVFAGKYNLGELYDKIGMTTASVDRGELAGIFSPDRQLGDAGRLKLRQFVDDFYETFLRKAAAGRKTTPEAVHGVAQGRVWTGAQAHQLGLVDELGSFRVAVNVAKEKAGIEGDVHFQILPKLPGFFDELLGRGVPGSALAPLMDRVAYRSNLPTSLVLSRARQMISVAPLLSSGAPVLMSPYAIDVH